MNGAEMQVEGVLAMTQCLIVDDSPADRSDIEALLAAYGFELESMGDAEKALDRCRAAMPDVILVAGRIASMEKVSFIKRLKRKADRRPVVFVYGDNGDPEEIGRAIWQGASECLLKPFDADILDQKLRQAGVV